MAAAAGIERLSHRPGTLMGANVRMLSNQTLVVDVNASLIGIYSVERREYRSYADRRRLDALRRIARAREVVTWGGTGYDVPELLKLAQRHGLAQFALLGKHTDMKEVCWSPRIHGSDLRRTYETQFGQALPIPKTYDEDVRRDVTGALALWKAWKAGTLKIVDGRQR